MRAESLPHVSPVLLHLSLLITPCFGYFTVYLQLACLLSDCSLPILDNWSKKSTARLCITWRKKKRIPAFFAPTITLSLPKCLKLDMSNTTLACTKTSRCLLIFQKILKMLGRFSCAFLHVPKKKQIFLSIHTTFKAHSYIKTPPVQRMHSRMQSHLGVNHFRDENIQGLGPNILKALKIFKL